MKTFFKVKSQWRADTLQEHFANINIAAVELIPGNIYQFLPEEKKVVLPSDMDEIPYIIDERAFFCLEYLDQYRWKYKSKNTDILKVLCEDADELLHHTCDNLFIEPNMMLVDTKQVSYIVLEDIYKNYVYYNLSTKEYQYTFDNDIVAVYGPHNPSTKTRRLIWREKEKEVSIKELVECYAQQHNFDPKNIIVI